jgi:gliding motility-associated-like protein
LLNKLKHTIKKFSPDFLSGSKPVFILLLLTCSFVRAQNLIPNGDFEEYWICPNGISNLLNPPPFPDTNPYSPKYWYDPSFGTSDYFNACSTLPSETGVPSNAFGFQFPHSGNGYCGFSALSSCPEWCAEYIATPLKESLKAGQSYCLSFWIVNSDSSCWVNNGIGAWLSTDSIYFSNRLDELGQVIFNEVITDKENWINMEASFVANGGEKYITISNVSNGNFDSIHVCNTPVYAFSYYYIDDVSLIEGGCNGSLNNIDIPNIVTPNNDSANDIWTFECDESINVEIINRWGNVVYQFSGFIPKWNADNESDGIYFYKISNTKTVKTGFIQLMR